MEIWPLWLMTVPTFSIQVPATATGDRPPARARAVFMRAYDPGIWSPPGLSLDCLQDVFKVGNGHSDFSSPPAVHGSHVVSFRMAPDEKATSGAFVDIEAFLILRKNQRSR